MVNCKKGTNNNFLKVFQGLTSLYSLTGMICHITTIKKNNILQTYEDSAPILMCNS